VESLLALLAMKGGGGGGGPAAFTQFPPLFSKAK
jgi:hypothetical protein